MWLLVSKKTLEDVMPSLQRRSRTPWISIEGDMSETPLCGGPGLGPDSHTFVLKVAVDP